MTLRSAEIMGNSWEIRRETHIARFVNGHGETEQVSTDPIWRLYLNGNALALSHWWSEAQACAWWDQFTAAAKA